MPQIIQTDNGLEFTGHALDAWAYKYHVKLFFIKPGKPVLNAHIKSINDKLRNECLHMEWFVNLQEAQQVIAQWRVHYNCFRPHSALGNTTPEVWQQQQQVEKLYASVG